MSKIPKFYNLVLLFSLLAAVGVFAKDSKHFSASDIRNKQAGNFNKNKIFTWLPNTVKQAPVVSKIEPPSWWANSTISPVRILIKGENLKGSIIKSKTVLLRASNFSYSANGHYLFADLYISSMAKPGRYELSVVNKNREVKFEFELFKPAARLRRPLSANDLIYFIFIDRFVDGDVSNNDPAISQGLFDRSKPRRYHGGDIAGIISKLDYIKSLGATAIWTTPIYDNNNRLDFKEVYDNEPTTGYHGYGAVDFYSVEEHFGDIGKLEELARRAHLSGITLIQDQIANHTGPYHPWAEDPPTPTWFNGTVKNHIPNNWQKWTTMNPRATYQTQRGNLDGWFVDILPDLNQNDPEVSRYLIQNSLWWIARIGFDGIRMDTLPHVPRTFWQKWTRAIHREFPDVKIIGELFDGDPTLLSFFQGGRRGFDGVDTGIDTLFDFTLYFAIRNSLANGGQIRQISQVFAHDWLYPKPELLVTFLGNHDVPRFMSEKGATPGGLKLATALLLTSRGIPLIYYGDEIGLSGGGDPDNRRDFPGGFPGDRRNAFAASERTNQENDIWNFTAKLANLRQVHPALRIGKSLDLFDGEQQLVFARVTKDEALIIAINNDQSQAVVEFDYSMIPQLVRSRDFIDLLDTDTKISTNGRRMKIQLEPKSVVIISGKQ